jgi:hypothetical protein
LVQLLPLVQHLLRDIVQPLSLKEYGLPIRRSRDGHEVVEVSVESRLSGVFPADSFGEFEAVEL